MAFKKGYKPWNKGKKLSEKHKENARKAREGKPTRYWQGKSRSEKTKKKIGIKLTGRKLSKKTREKMGESRMGNKNPSWLGGKSFEPYSVDWTETLKRSIRERDHYTCQLCGQYGDLVHHIDYDKKNCDPKNLITLCRKGNSIVNFNRKYWINYFNKLLRIKLC